MAFLEICYDFDEIPGHVWNSIFRYRVHGCSTLNRILNQFNPASKTTFNIILIADLFINLLEPEFYI